MMTTAINTHRTTVMTGEVVAGAGAEEGMIGMIVDSEEVEGVVVVGSIVAAAVVGVETKVETCDQDLNLLASINPNHLGPSHLLLWPLHALQANWMGEGLLIPVRG